MLKYKSTISVCHEAALITNHGKFLNASQKSGTRNHGETEAGIFRSSPEKYALRGDMRLLYLPGSQIGFSEELYL
jgi:hypothetical protein